MVFLQWQPTAGSQRLDGIVWLLLVVVLAVSAMRAFLLRSETPPPHSPVIPVQLRVPKALPPPAVAPDPAPDVADPIVDPAPETAAMEEAEPVPMTLPENVPESAPENLSPGEPKSDESDSGEQTSNAAAPRPMLDLRLPPELTSSAGSTQTPFGATLNNSDMRAPQADPRMVPLPEAPPFDAPYINTFGEVERRISNDCVLRQYIERLPIGNDELVVYIASCQKRGDAKLKRDLAEMAQRRKKIRQRAGTEK